MSSGPFVAADGARLWAHWHAQPAAASPRGGVLIVHGYADHGGRYVELGERLVARGYATMAFDYRGHGRAGGKRGHCLRFADFLGDLDGAIAQLRGAIGDDAPLWIYSHSHGGLVV